MFSSFIEPVKSGRHLTSAEIEELAPLLLDSQLPDEPKAELLMALAVKGETTEEMAAFAAYFRARSIIPQLSPSIRQAEILDVCGTGGDRLNTFNISTTVALVAAAAGVIVAKHGNRAVTSSSGSADVLDALGIPTDLSPVEAAEWLEQRQFAFFFAPLYHPAFKNLASARKLCALRGQRTVFNLLGPLLNPARPTAQLIGVPSPDWCEKMARAARALGVRRAMVVSGKIGGEPHAHLDEISIFGETTVAEFFHDRGFTVSRFSAQELGCGEFRLEEIQGGDARVNAGIIESLLSGREEGAKLMAVVVNAGAALFVAGHSRSITEGMEAALELIRNGKARQKLEELRRAGKERSRERGSTSL